MKFIHTGDIHWGMCPDSDKAWSKERTLAIRNTFEAIIAQAKNHQVDFLFITGDLFHRQPLTKDLKEINYLFSTIPQVRVVIIAGNHDRIRSNSAMLNFTWNPNVTYFMDEHLSSVYFEDMNTEIFGFSYHSAEIKDARLEGIQAPLNNHIHILMAHGGDAKHLPFNKEALAASNFSYIALGHIHKPEVLVENKMAFCGSPEPLDKTETGSHGIFLGEINPNTRKVTSLNFIPIAAAQYVPLMVNVSPTTTNTELAMRMNQEMEKRGTQNIYRFHIQGSRDPEITFDLESLLSRWKIAEIIDDSEPEYDYNTLLIEHPGDMIGFYIQELRHDQMSPLDQKALNYGLYALLHTTDERSTAK